MRHSLHALLVALTVSFVAACSPSSSGAEQADPAVEVGNLDGATVVASGSFSGRNDHVVTGALEVLELDGRMYVRLASDFTLDGAPDPKIGFGRSGEYDESTTFTPLKSHSGSQDYALPEGFQLGTLNEAYIWCEKFSVALGVAAL